MVERVLVLGGGSAGFLAAMSLKRRMPDLCVTVLRSKEIGIIGVGEGTTVSVVTYLHGVLGIDAGAFHRAVRPTWKLGIRFLWGPRPSFNYTFGPQFNLHYKSLPRPSGFYADGDAEGEFAALNTSLMSRDRAFARLKDGGPAIRNDVGYHLENTALVAFFEAHAASMGIEVVDDTVLQVEQDDGGVAALQLASGGRVTADLYVDCSGFGSVLLGKALGEPFVSFKPSLFCDRAVVGGWQRGAGDEVIRPYTTAETMTTGWCWQIEHDERVNRGYVYSSDFISDDDAEAEFRGKNAKVGPTRVVRFASGRYERTWVKNVVAIGNSNGFVEPLEATSLAVICDECNSLALSLIESHREPGPAMRAVYNRRAAGTWDCIRQFLALHYKFNTRLDTPFWAACREKTDLCGAQAFVDYYQEVGPTPLWRETIMAGRDNFGIEGYLTMMVGQRVPYHDPRPPTAAEREAWRQIQQANRTMASYGYTVREACDIVRGDRWRYDPAFYGKYAF